MEIAFIFKMVRSNLGTQQIWPCKKWMGAQGSGMYQYSRTGLLLEAALLMVKDTLLVPIRTVQWHKRVEGFGSKVPSTQPKHRCSIAWDFVVSLLWPVLKYWIRSAPLRLCDSYFPEALLFQIHTVFSNGISWMVNLSAAEYRLTFVSKVSSIYVILISF